MSRWVALFVAAFLAGCAAPKVDLNSTFDPREVAYIKANGSGQIAGQAFLKTVGGDVKYAAGNAVTLIPAGTYARERMNAIYGGGRCAARKPDFGRTDPAYEQYMRRTTADGEGRFSFNGLAAGPYYVVTFVAWGAPTGYGVSVQGCSLVELVDLAVGQRADIILTSQ